VSVAPIPKLVTTHRRRSLDKHNAEWENNMKKSSLKQYLTAKQISDDIADLNRNIFQDIALLQVRHLSYRERCLFQYASRRSMEI
jgi:hypothetical protein